MTSSENVCKYPFDYNDIVGYHVIDNHAVGIISNSICLKVYYLWLTGNHALHRSAWQNSAGLSYTGAGRAVDGRFTNLNFAEDSVRRHRRVKQKSDRWILEILK